MGLARRVGVIFFLLLISALTTLYASIRFSRALSSQLGLILNSINRNTDIHRTEENLSSNLASFKRDLDDLLEIRKIHEAQISRIRAAEQVEHDIRSPLFVLRAILPGVDGVSAEEKRALIESVERISEIAKDLRAIPPFLDPSPRLKDPVSGTCVSPASKAAIPLDSMMTVKSALDSLISEKILEHSKRNPIHLDFDQSLESLGLFAKKETFARVISNLLNNAIEASPAKSAIVVNVRLAEDQSLILSVMDQGKGISAEDLKHMGVRGFTRGKAEGSGLGLWAAREFLTSLGARLEVDSMLDVGTTVSMLFPRECWAMIQAP
jgi:signal transduction histidine kinase